MLATVGYEGVSVEEFICELKKADVKILIDVRERAQSRRRGFSKTRLSENLNEAGIEYLHFRELGDPKEGRDAARSGDYREFRRIYRNVLKRKVAQIAMAEIIEIIEGKHTCLMCYERDETTCHRKIITDKIQEKTGIDADHLKVRAIEPPASTKRRVLHLSEGASAQI